MLTLEFKRIYAKNFMCYGPEGFELIFKNLSNIINVQGKNFDDMKDGNPGSNGSGKTSVVNILTGSLFGKSTKKLTLQELVHTKATSKDECKLVTEWDIYKVERTIKQKGTQTIRLWESPDCIWNDETEISKGAGITKTQEAIQDRLKLDFRTFVNIIYFDDRNSNGFLECDAPDKRKIIENLLSLEKYCEFEKIAKDFLKETEKEIKSLTNEYSKLTSIFDSSKARTEKLRTQEIDWKNNKLKEINTYIEQIKTKRNQISSIDTKSKLEIWTNAQNRITILNEEIQTLESKQQEINEFILKTKQQISTKESELKTKESIHLEKEREIRDLKSKYQELKSEESKLNNLTPGVVCGECFEPIKQEKYEEHKKTNQIKQQEILSPFQKSIEEAKTFKENEIIPIQKQIDELNQLVVEANNKNTTSQTALRRKELQGLVLIAKPDEDSETKLLEAQIETLKAQTIKAKTESEQSPYKDNIEDGIKEENERAAECRIKKDELAQTEKKVPYYKYWINAFGDNGIRKFVIEGILPALNSRISHWLDCLIYGNISLKFDSSLKETINRVPYDNDEFVYNAMSGGEQRRINLAVTLSFAYVMMLNSGRNPNIIFLDEVAINIDENGLDCVYNMILKLSKDKKVFVTTHDPGLLSMLQGHTRLQLEKRNGFTKLVN